MFFWLFLTVEPRADWVLGRFGPSLRDGCSLAVNPGFRPPRRTSPWASLVSPYRERCCGEDETAASHSFVKRAIGGPSYSRAQRRAHSTALRVGSGGNRHLPPALMV